MNFNNNEWFNVNEFKDGVWFISDKTGVNCFLVEGDTTSLLIDTGWGLANIGELVGSLTSLPVNVVFTHGHPDHVNGAFQFSDLYIKSEDKKLMEMFYVKETREQIINRFKDILSSDFSIDDWVNAQITKPSHVSDGYIFDLGNRKLRVIECPGHTAGSICLLDTKDDILFSGDSLLAKPVLMNLETSLGLKTYLKSIEYVNSFADDFNIILSGHDEKPVDPIVMEELISGVSDIIQGKIEGKVEKTRFGDALQYNFEHTAINYNEDSI
jgi:glyoxylase-like metal-dependent hydrolase (beta-lactamase superfamily II)